MKSFKYLLLFLVFAVACGVDDDGQVSAPVDPVNENNSVQATINGQDFASTDSNTFAQIPNETSLRIVGREGLSFIEILIEGYTGTGLYSLEAGDPNISLDANYVITSNEGAPNRTWDIISDDSSLGQVTITEASDTSITGTFSFTLFNESEDSTLVFSNGTMTVEVQ